MVAVPIRREREDIDEALHERVEPSRKRLAEILPLNRARLSTRVVLAIPDDLDWALKRIDQNTVNAGKVVQVGSGRTRRQDSALLKRQLDRKSTRLNSS